VAYIGDKNVVCTTNCAAVPVVLRAKITETDTMPGDLSKATVAFVNRATGLTIATVPAAADGTASFNWSASVTATQTIKIGMIVSNYYFRSSTLDDGSVVITKQ